MTFGPINVETEYREGDETVYPSREPYKVEWENDQYTNERIRKCEHCELELTEYPDGWRDKLVDSLYCDDDTEEQQHEPYTLTEPLDWWHSATIETDSDPKRARVTVTICVSEAGEKFVMSLERTSLGRYMLGIPHPEESNQMHAWPGTLDYAASPGAFMAEF